jgi:hypothetical protein
VPNLSDPRINYDLPTLPQVNYWIDATMNHVRYLLVKVQSIISKMEYKWHFISVQSPMILTQSSLDYAQ